MVIALRYASALDLVPVLNRLLGEGGAAAPGEAIQRVAIAADGRTNSIIVRSDSPTRLARVRALITQLDIGTESAGNIHIMYLRNADASIGSSHASFCGRDSCRRIIAAFNPPSRKNANAVAM